MTIIVSIDYGGHEVVEKRLTNIQAPEIVAPGMFVFSETNGRVALAVPFPRIVSLEYEDNLVTVPKNILN